jgi:hypothetical protein
MFESLQILKDGYKHEIISASGEVKALLEAQAVPFSLASDLGALSTAV